MASVGVCGRVWGGVGGWECEPRRGWEARRLGGAEGERGGGGEGEWGKVPVCVSECPYRDALLMRNCPPPRTTIGP